MKRLLIMALILAACSQVNGQTEIIRIESDGKIVWTDVNLYRLGPDSLKTDDDLYVGGKLSATGVLEGVGFKTISNATSPQVIGGHADNTVSGSKVGQTISGGGAVDSANSIAGDYGTISGGLDIHIGGGPWCTVGGGRLHNIEGALAATISGGDQNTITTMGIDGTISGGYENIVGGQGSVVPGGGKNEALGNFSWAGGYRAKTAYLTPGVFAWADFTGADFDCAVPNSFNVRATGGVNFVTKLPGDGFFVDTDGNVTISGTLDSVDIAAHDHSSTTGQARIAAKDRWRTLEWFIESDLVLGFPFYWGGSGPAGQAGYIFPYPVHLTKATVMGLASRAIEMELSVYNGSNLVGTVTCTATGAGFFRGSGNLTGDYVDFDDTNDELNMVLDSEDSIWSDMSVVLEYTVD